MTVCESVFFRPVGETERSKKNTLPPAGQRPTFRAGKLNQITASVFFDRSEAGLAWNQVKGPDRSRKTPAVEKKHFASGWLDADFLSREIKSENLRLFFNDRSLKNRFIYTYETKKNHGAVCFGGHARRLPRQLIVRKKTQRVAHGIAEAPEGSAPIFPMALHFTDELPLTAPN